MNGPETVGEGVGSIFHYLGELAFRWVPGTVMAVSNPDAVGTSTPLFPTTPITHPVTTSEVVQYLQTISQPGVYDDVYHRWDSFVAFSTVVSLICSALIIYCVIRIRQIRYLEAQKYKEAAHTVTARDIPKTQLRWNRIVTEATSDNEQQWRLAILEADIMLNELLDMQGYKGETMGDKMRGVERGDFNTIDIAWEAHRVRNRIAHEGQAHILTDREVRRVIGLYERVFREFHLIK